MLLERIEIDTRGTLGLVQLGPFSPRLNAILGPVTHDHGLRPAAADGTSGLPVVPFLRALMLGSRASQAMVGGWSGRVVWADTDGLLHCRRELDGTLQGRLAVDFEPREPAVAHLPADAHFSGYLQRRLSQLPPSIIEAVIAQSDGSGSVFAALRAAHRAGLDQVTESASLQPEQRRELERLQTQVDQLQRRLDGSGIDGSGIGEQTRAQLSDRRDQLQAELDSLEHLLQSAREQRLAEQTHRRGRQHRLLELHEQTRRLSEQESELRGNLTDIEAALRALTFDSVANHPRVVVAESHRRQLEDLDGQLIRWRRTLAEVRGMREQLGYCGPADAETDATPQARTAEDWDARLEAAHRQIDWLTVRYAYGDPLCAYNDPLSDAPVAAPDEAVPAERAACHANDLIEQLHAIKSELGRLCKRFAHDATSGSYWSQESARAQLQRCECELLDSIARLVRHRHRLLRRI